MAISITISFINFNIENARWSSGGTVVYCENEIVPGVEIVKNQYDANVWLKLDKYSFERKRIYTAQNI